jgi:tellurite resistance protein TerB
LISSNPVLQNFDSTILQDKFNYYCDKLSQDFDFGKIEALQAVAKLKKKEDQGRAVVQIGIIIGGADGNFDSGEKKVLREVCHSLGIDPAQFDL